MRNLIMLPIVAALAACGSITIGPPGDPVASISLSGPVRAKVGVAYPVVATLRTADGTVVDRPVSWSVLAPDQGTVTIDGQFVASDTGAIIIRAAVDGVTSTHLVTGYDWQESSDVVTKVLRLDSDNLVANRVGVVSQPDLVVLCAAGTFYVVVIVDGMEIADGTVRYRFDNGAVHEAEWLPASGAGALIFPGTSNAAHKDFASAIAASGTFRFAFREHAGDEHELEFRVAGLAERIVPLLVGCPVDA